MSLTETAEKLIKDELDRVSRQIMIEMKRECPKKSGSAATAISIMEESPFSRFVGVPINWGNHQDPGMHLYYACHGNGGRGRIIEPTHSRALRIQDGFGNTVAFRAYVHGYSGHNFIADIAAKHS